MAEKLYTLSQVKEAFWDTFHKSGELWFPYEDENECTEATDEYWQEFLEYLQKEEK